MLSLSKSFIPSFGQNTAWGKTFVRTRQKASQGKQLLWRCAPGDRAAPIVVSDCERSSHIQGESGREAGVSISSVLFVRLRDRSSAKTCTDQPHR